MFDGLWFAVYLGLKPTMPPMFYGYQSEEEMRKYNPDMADHIISIAEQSQAVVCSRHKKCVGSIGGKTFVYADGSTDEGITITSFRAKLGGDVFRWSRLSV